MDQWFARLSGITDLCCRVMSMAFGRSAARYLKIFKAKSIGPSRHLKATQTPNSPRRQRKPTKPNAGISPVSTRRRNFVASSRSWSSERAMNCSQSIALITEARDVPAGLSPQHATSGGARGLSLRSIGMTHQAQCVRPVERARPSGHKRTRTTMNVI